MKNNTKIILPIVVAISVIFGYWLYSFTGKSKYVHPQLREQGSEMKLGKLDQILNIIDTKYYKDINRDSIANSAILTMIKDLDPHSAYISSDKMLQVLEDMQGHFSGIGVQFFQYKDTVMVIRPIPQGPSEGVGIKAGDRIVSVDMDTIANQKLSTDTIMSKLKGVAGTQVRLGIRRNNADTLKYFDVTRGDISVSTVDIAYMVDEKTGFIKIKQFGQRSYYDLMNALEKLKEQDMQRLIIDLRGNQGGLLDVAVAMINEFMNEGDLIVYTKGKSSPRIDKRANGKGNYKNLPIVVLIDTYSASASEIFAGAIQDQDRGIIVGRRSFGKGLVQEQIEFSDMSALRLTVAEYFTPSGRNIQKPFKVGDKEAYNEDIMRRFEHGEFITADSIQFPDSLKFQTKNGRTVYGGGGIMPDVFVPLDTIPYNDYYTKLQYKGVIRDFAFLFADQHREELSSYKTVDEMVRYIEEKHYLSTFLRYAQKEGIPMSKQGYKQAKEIIEEQLLALILNNINEDMFYLFYHKTDEILKKGMDSFDIITEK